MIRFEADSKSSAAPLFLLSRNLCDAAERVERSREAYVGEALGYRLYHSRLVVAYVEVRLHVALDLALAAALRGTWLSQPPCAEIMQSVRISRVFMSSAPRV